MDDSIVPLPVSVALKVNAPCLFTVPAKTLSPSPFVTGMLSPVSMLSSMAEHPPAITPSTATPSLGRTSTVSPGLMSFVETHTSTPSFMTVALLGWSLSRLSTAESARDFAFASNILPKKTSVITMAHASK